MASYIESVISKDERVMYSAKISAWSLMPLILIGFILLPMFIGVFFWIVAFIRYKTTELAITNKRVIAKFGFISRKTIEINIVKVESIQVIQGVLGRICNFGSLIFSGAGNPQAPIPGIFDPLVFHRIFNETQENFTQQTAKIIIDPKKAEAKACSNCGSGMKERTAHSGERTGQKFLVCTKYPECKNVLPL